MNRAVIFSLNTFISGVFCLILPAITPTAVHADYVSIKGTVVNVRQGPGTSHPVLFQAEQGEEFNLVNTQGLWCRIELEQGQEAWVFKQLVDIRPGNRPGVVSSEPEPEGPESPESRWAGAFRLGMAVLIFILAVFAFWKRKELLRRAGAKLRDVSGYKREQAFRYDNRKPSDDSWEL